MATQASLHFVQQLYVAYYGRPADSAGLQYWAEQADANGQAAIVSAFGESAEFQERFGSLDSPALVNNLYQQLFGRDGDSGGVEYYAGVLERGEKSLSEIALTIKNAAQGADREAFNSRVDAANAYTQKNGSEGNYDLEDAKNVVSDIEWLSTEDFVQQLYVAYYGRPADSAGLDYWAGQADSQGWSSIIEAFGNSKEFQDEYGSLSNEQLVNNLYQQLFGRDAEAEGLAYYTGVLDRGEKSLSEIAVTIFYSAEGEDKEIFDARVDAANAYTQEFGGDAYNAQNGRDVILAIVPDDTGSGGGDNGGGEPETVEEAVKAYNDFDDLADAFSDADNALQAAYREGEPTEQLLADFNAAKANVINGFTATKFGDDEDIFREITGERKALEAIVTDEKLGGIVTSVGGDLRAYVSESDVPAEEEESVGYSALAFNTGADDSMALFQQSVANDDVLIADGGTNGTIDDASAPLIGIEDNHSDFGNDMIA